MNVIDSRLSLDHKGCEIWDLVVSRHWSCDYVDATTSDGFVHERTVPLPEALLDTYRQCECAMFSGLFPEINRAWISIDDRLFLWNYEDGRDFCVYDGVDQVIVSVGLVRAKPYLFVDEVKYLLLVATPVEVVALAVSFEQDVVNGELTLHPTGLSVPSDNVHMVSIVGSDDGRAFMAGADGNLYELSYAADDSWLARRPMKCRKVNRSATVLGTLVPSFLKYLLHAADDPLTQLAIDSSRGVLYTLSEHSRLEVRLVGGGVAGSAAVAAKGGTAPCVAWLDAHHWRRQLADMCPRAADQDMQLVAIHAVPLHESGHVHLIAITARGSRLYFTTHRVESWTASDDGDLKPPRTLKLVHARLPPAAPPGAHEPRASPGSAWASAGVSAVALARGADVDALSLTALLLPGDASAAVNAMAIDDRAGGGGGGGGSPVSLATAGSGTLRECADVLPLDARVLAVAEQPRPPLADPYLVTPGVRRAPATRMQLADAPTGIQLGSSLARHPHAAAHLQPPRRLLCFTGTGVVTLARKSPSDTLRDLLLRSRGDASRELEAFFHHHGAAEAAAMCFMLATAPPPSGASCDIGVRRAGTPPSLLQHVGPLANTRPPNADLVQAAVAALNRYGGVPSVRTQSAAAAAATGADLTVGRAVLEAQVDHSGTHDGLALYVARLVRPVWQFNVASELDGVAAGRVESRVNAAGLERVERPLHALAGLLERTPSFAPPLAARAHTAALRKEAESLAALRAALAGTLHALAFWRTLCEHDFARLAARLAPADRSRLLATRFCDLVVVPSAPDAPPSAPALDAQAMARVLLNELIAQHSESGQSVDFLASQLRTRCPTLFVEGDRTRFGAHELLQSARNTTNAAERAALLAKAVERFGAVAATVNVAAVCRSLCSLRCYDGALEVVLAHTAAIDPQQRALRYHVESGASSSAFAATPSGGGGGFSPRTPGQAPPQLPHSDADAALLHRRCLEAYAALFEALDELLLARDNEPDARLAQEYSDAFEATKRSAVASDDQLFHICLYDWLLRPGANGRVSLESELLSLNTPYLEAYLKATSIDLLCRFYVRVGKLDGAALILCKLAEQRGNEQTLEQRIANLSRAKGCLAQVTGPLNAALRDIPDKLDVARLQLRIRRRLELALEPKSAAAAAAAGGAAFHEAPVDDAVTHAVRELNEQLFNLTELFNKYAKPHRLWELQLAIIHSSGHTDAALARRLWHHLIQERAASDSTSVLAGKIVELGREYYPSDVTFPLPTVALLLERVALARIAAGDGSHPLWVARALHGGGASWPALFAVYDGLAERADNDAAFAAEAGLRLRLLHVLQLLLDAWLLDAPDAGTLLTEHRVRECVEKYLVALGSVPPSTLAALNLTQNQLEMITSRLRAWL